jgi:phage terminase Nu1 subunit (DNA packaging protein)
MNGRKSKAPHSLSELARRFKVQRRTLARWAAEGIDLSDLEAVARRAAAKRAGGKAAAASISAAAGQTGGAETYAQAQTRKMRAQADKEELLARRLRGEFVERATVEDWMARIGAAGNAALHRLQADLPPMLVGMNETEMQRVIRAKIDEVVATIRDATNEVWTDPIR